MAQSVVIVLTDDGYEVYGPYNRPHLAQADVEAILKRNPEAQVWTEILLDPPFDKDL